MAADPWRAALALLAAETVSRTAMMRVWHDLPPARSDGLAHDTGPPDAEAMLTAQVIALVIALGAVWPSFGLARRDCRHSPFARGYLYLHALRP